MAELARPLAVYIAIAACDRYPDHPVEIVTDGITIVATTGARWRAGSAWRSETGEIHVNCNHPLPYDQVCDGTVTFELSDTTRGVWDSDDKTIDELCRDGVKVER